MGQIKAVQDGRSRRKSEIVELIALKYECVQLHQPAREGAVGQGIDAEVEHCEIGQRVRKGEVSEAVDVKVERDRNWDRFQPCKVAYLLSAWLHDLLDEQIL